MGICTGQGAAACRWQCIGTDTSCFHPCPLASCSRSSWQGGIHPPLAGSGQGESQWRDSVPPSAGREHSLPSLQPLAKLEALPPDECSPSLMHASPQVGHLKLWCPLQPTEHQQSNHMSENQWSYSCYGPTGTRTRVLQPPVGPQSCGAMAAMGSQSVLAVTHMHYRCFLNGVAAGAELNF